MPWRLRAGLRGLNPGRLPCSPPLPPPLLRGRGQAQLWHMDDDTYFEEGKFLAIHGDSLMVGVDSIYDEAELPVWRGKNFRENNGIRLHMRMEMLQRVLLRDAFALAAALNRILVLPHMLCFCDRQARAPHALAQRPGAPARAMRLRPHARPHARLRRSLP